MGGKCDLIWAQRGEDQILGDGEGSVSLAEGWRQSVRKRNED